MSDAASVVLAGARVLVGGAGLAVAWGSVALAVFEGLARAQERRPSVVAAFTLALLAAGPLVLGAPLHSIIWGLMALVVLLSPLSVLGARRLLRSAWSVDAPDVPASLAIATVVILGAWVSLTTRLWDGALAHYGFASSIARGVLPPEHPLFPGEPLRYHVGYDVLVAQLVATTRIDVGVACELVAIGCLVLLATVLRDTGRALAGGQGDKHARVAGALAVVVAPLGYGTFAMCLADGWGTPLGCPSWFPSSWVSAPRLPPPVISNFFQHPQGLAMPIALAILLVAAERPSTRRTVAAAVGLALLSRSQIAFFAVAGLSAGIAVVVDAVMQRQWRDVLWRAAALGAALVVATRGGVLAGGEAMGELVWGKGYFSDAGLMLALRHAALFGLPLLALPLALVRLRRPSFTLRLALVSGGAVSLLVPDVVSYARSWDIVKFFGIGIFLANILLAEWLASLWPLAPMTRSGPRRALVVALLLLSTASGGLWLVRHGPLNGLIAFRYGFGPPSALGAALRDADGDVIAARDRVLTSATEIWQLGFSIAGADWRGPDGRGFMVDRARADRNLRLARRALMELDADGLRQLDARWVLLGPGDLARVSPAGRALLDSAAFVRHPDVDVNGVPWQLYRVERER